MPKTVNEVFRDFTRWTGDGLPNEPVGHPLPIGDPRSGIHHPPKADMREALGGVFDAAADAEAARDAAETYAGAATGTPQYQTAAEVAAINVPAYADQIIVGDSIYVRDDTDGSIASGDGKRWTRLAFHGRFDRMVADMARGVSTIICAYGDSTTDGAGTTGWTANPTSGGNAVGAMPHTPPNAWPAQCQAALRPMFNNVSISVTNAGYGGKTIYDGWAYANYQNAVLGPYPNPHAVIVNFGLNDVVRVDFSLEAFETQLLLLCRKIARYGAFPIFVTPDETLAHQRDGVRLTKVNAIYRSVAERLGVKVIDWGTAINELSQCSDGTDWRWGDQIQDNTHGGDAFHSVKGAFVAAAVFPNTLWVKEGVTDVAPWSKFCNPIAGYGVAHSVLNKFGSCIIIHASTYALDQQLLNLWVWSVGAARAMYWAAVDGNNYLSPRSLADAPRIGVFDYQTMTARTITAPGSGPAAGGAGQKEAESMGLLYRVPNGLSRWTFRAPRDNNTSDVYLGYFSIREVRTQFSFAYPAYGDVTSATIIDTDPGGDVSQVWGIQHSRSLNRAIEVDLEPSMGVCLWSSRVYGGSVTRENNRKTGVFLYRHPDDRLSLVRAVFDADGSIVSQATLGSSAALTWAGKRKLRIVGSVNSTPAQNLAVYDGWGNTGAIINVNNVLTNAPWPWGGTPGAIWQHTGTKGVVGLTIYGDV